MRTLPAVLLVLVTACVKVPAFEQKDAPGTGTSGVSIYEDGAGVSVDGPGYRMHFSGEGARFPTELTLGGQNWIGDAMQCADEAGVGVALYPELHANGTFSNAVKTADSMLRIALGGQTVGQARLNWKGTYTCQSQIVVTGNSTFTFFPDGRITRYDHISQPGVTASLCGRCDSPASATDFYLTSYATFVVPDSATLTDERPVNSYGSQTLPLGPASCMSYNGQQLALAWTLPSATRLRVVNVQSPSLSYVFDIEHSTMLSGDYEATTQMAIAAGQDCAALEARITPFTMDQYQLRINGTTIGGQALGDGIFGGEPNEGFTVTSLPVVLDAPNGMPAGWAVWLQLPTHYDQFTVTHSSQQADGWYYDQPVGPTGLVLWFNVPLQSGDAIRIEGQ